MVFCGLNAVTRSAREEWSTYAGVVAYALSHYGLEGEFAFVKHVDGIEDERPVWSL